MKKIEETERRKGKKIRKEKKKWRGKSRKWKEEK